MLKGQLGGFMKQAQEMQENLKKAQDEIANKEITGSAGAGLVNIIITGKYDVKKIAIDESLLGDDKEMLEDLVAAAFNDAVRKVESYTQEKMSSVSGGMTLPPGMKLPF